MAQTSSSCWKRFVKSIRRAQSCTCIQPTDQWQRFHAPMQLPLIFAKITVTYSESDITAVRVLRRELELVAFVRTHPNLVFLWHKRLSPATTD